MLQQQLNLTGLPGEARVDVVVNRARGKEKKGPRLRERFDISVYQHGKFQLGLEVVLKDRSIKVVPTNSPGRISSALPLELITYDTKFFGFSDYLQTLHRFETSRCRSSRFWPAVKNSPPGKRGNFLISLGGALYSQEYQRHILLRVAPSGNIVDFTVVRGLNIGFAPLKVTYVALEEDSDRIDFGIGGLAARDFSKFSYTCGEMYRLPYRNTRFSNQWMPLYSTQDVDESASRMLDLEFKRESIKQFFALGYNGYEAYDVQNLAASSQGLKSGNDAGSFALFNS